MGEFSVGGILTFGVRVASAAFLSISCTLVADSVELETSTEWTALSMPGDVLYE